MTVIYSTELVVGMEAISGLVSEISRSLVSNGISDKINQELQLAFEEAVTNVFMHGYKGEGWVSVTCSILGDEIIITLKDRAPCFNPNHVPRPNTEAELDDRPVGGLGMHFIRQISDRCEYKYENGENIFSMVKKTGT